MFSFGLDLTKLFSDVDAETAAETKLYDSVKFKIQNKTDGTWIIAKRNDEEGVYYVTGHTDKEADATVFTPVTMGKSYGHIMVKGLEEDTYTITETQTANGYTLLKNAITVTISYDDDLNGKIVVIRPGVLRREYQLATRQLKLCIGGFGASPHSRGSACFCVYLYSGDSSRFERRDILGTLEPEQLPQWAKQGLEQYQREQSEKRKERER